MDNTLRLRLENYEFDDEKELKLTLELINRIEKDIDSAKSVRTSDGYTAYASIAALAGAFYLFFTELSKFGELSQIPFGAIGALLISFILTGKLSWTFFQLIYIDSSPIEAQTRRFRWTNHQFYDQRLNLSYQLLIFIILALTVFFIGVPLWVAISTALSFGIYVFLLGLVFVMSYRKEAYSENNKNKSFNLILTIFVIILSIVSCVGLWKTIPPPVGNSAKPFILSGILFAILFLLNIVVVLSSPSLILDQLRKLRRDIIFLRLELKDAWILYEIYTEGNEMTEEMLSIFESVTYLFNSIEYHQTKQKELTSEAQTIIENLQNNKNITKKDFKNLYVNKIPFNEVNDSLNEIYTKISTLVSEFAEKVNKISGATKEKEKADRYHEYVQNRFNVLAEQEKEINAQLPELDEKIRLLESKIKPIESSKIQKDGKR